MHFFSVVLIKQFRDNIEETDERTWKK